MSKDKARAYYLNRAGGKKMNCAQAVMAAFKDKFSIDEDTIRKFAAYGIGNAPNGLCGAYYAAKFILEGHSPDKVKECEEFFLSRAGSLKCREIKKVHKYPCAECVGTAAEFVEKIESKNCSASHGNITCASVERKRGISMEGQVRLIAGCMVVTGIALAWLVHWAFIFISLFVGCGLIYAGLTDNCLMAIFLAKLPYNKE